MNKRLVISVVAIGLIASALVYALSRPAAAPELTADSQQSTTATTASPVENTGNSSPGAYLDYDDAAFADTNGTRLLFFHAPWCPQCRALDDSIASGTVPDGVTIFKTDYDSRQDLRQRYGVTIQTTVIRVDENGEAIETYVAYDDPSLGAVVSNLLQ